MKITQQNLVIITNERDQLKLELCRNSGGFYSYESMSLSTILNELEQSKRILKEKEEKNINLKQQKRKSGSIFNILGICLVFVAVYITVG